MKPTQNDLKLDVPMPLKDARLSGRSIAMNVFDLERGHPGRSGSGLLDGQQGFGNERQSCACCGQDGRAPRNAYLPPGKKVPILSGAAERLRRRELLISGIRYLAAGVIAAVSLVLLRPFQPRRAGFPCVKALPCNGCPVFVGCELPQSLSTRQTLEDKTV